MKISINKDSTIPLRDQLIEQIGLKIASGALKSKEKLPSIRALATRLGIHYSTVTAAYNHLADVGLLDIRQGSGVRVATRIGYNENQIKGDDLDAVCQDFLAAVSEQGYSREELRKSLDRMMSKKPVRRILAVDRNRDFHKLLLSELQPHFSLPVETCTVEEILAHKEWMEDALIVTSLYHLFSFQEAVVDRTRLVVSEIEPARDELEHVAKLPEGSLVLLVSVSPTMINMATKLLAAERGDQIAVRSVLSNEAEELKYMMKYANLVMCDSASESVVKPVAAKAKVLSFRLYQQSTIERIEDRLRKWG